MISATRESFFFENKELTEKRKNEDSEIRYNKKINENKINQ